ncbi:threonine--tRNA ligase [Candidatus Saccharibacteria bacterium]|nr:threonine--tRNA ligase [Candidatus Saccharibacteria bacterium]
MSEKLESMRHTLSHVMAAAVKEMYPEAKFGIGPAIDDGFYYDIDFGKTKVVEADLAKIEKRMRKIIQAGFTMERAEKSREEALKWADENKQDLKRELIEELPEGETISFYTITTTDSKTLFEDLCKGPHVESSKEISPAFKLNRVAGAYWRGDEKRQMLTRLYGVAFGKEPELEEYLKKQEEAKARDHRKLGQQLDLFCNSPLVGSGLPLFTPRGTILRDLLNDFTQGYRLRAGYKKVCIPHIANVDLYKVSGHYEKFPEMLQFVSQESGDHLAIKPVSCPHHSQIFASLPRSYRELPVKYLETTMVYRDERKGELGGLSRVRAITQDDSHVFCTPEQVGDIFGELIEAAKDLYKRVNMKLHLRLSFRDDGDGYIGTPEMWEQAESQIKAMADKFKMDYFIGEGEAAMYGPKMDFMAVDALGREWQLATVQLDYAMPERFKLEYVAEDGTKKTPIMIHCALIGSIERFMSVFIEHTAGWFPLWCAPEQVRILTVNDQTNDYVAKVAKVLSGVVLDEPVAGNRLRFETDNSSDSLGKKIRRATDMKIPCVIIVGPKDAEEGQVSIRVHDDQAEGGAREEKVGLEQLADYLKGLQE